MASLPGIQTHSEPHYLADHFYFPRVLEIKHGRLRGGVRYQADDTLFEAAPPAVIAVAMFQKIDGPLTESSPSGSLNPAFRIVDYDERSGRDRRIHGPVFGAHKSVAKAADIDSAEKRQG